MPQAYQNMSLLDETLPLYIVLYDPDTQFVREIEVHQVSQNAREAGRGDHCRERWQVVRSWSYGGYREPHGDGGLCGRGR